MTCLPNPLPSPDQIAEEPLRPLLATVRAAIQNLLCALDTECFVSRSPEDVPADVTADPARWTTPALIRALENLDDTLDLHNQALTERNAHWRHGDESF